MSITKSILAMAGLFISAASVSADVPGLRAFDSLSPSVVWEVDVAIPSAINDVTQGISGPVAEFEYGQGAFYAPSTADNTDLFVLQPGTGTLLNTITMTFPNGGNVITSAEFVGGTLYGGFTTEGSGGPSSLVTIDYLTGVVSMVGAMGINAPTGGLAYDGSNMYTVNSGAGGPATLYTVNLGNGLATSIGSVLDAASGATVTLTGLEFGTDGVLYGLGRGLDNNMLFSIDPSTGTAMRLGSLSLENGTSLTTVPEPGFASLLVFGSMVGVAARRRRTGC